MIKKSQSNDSKGVQLTKDERGIFERLLKDQKIVVENSKKPITFPPVLLEFNGQPIVRENTLTVIKGQTGVHKSRVAEMLSSMLISIKPEKRAAMGFSYVRDEPVYVAYIDTERNMLDQFPEAIQRIKTIGGYKHDEHVKNFTVYTMINTRRNERIDVIKTIIKGTRKHVPIGDHLVIVIDVLTDTIADFNNITDTYSLTDELAVYMNEYNVSFIGVIHENPWTSKARGHLGTESINKASTVIQIVKSKPADHFWINIEKTRSSRIPRSSHVYYDESAGMLRLSEIAVNEMEDTKDEKLNKLIDVLEEMEQDIIAQTDLVALTGMKSTTLVNKLEILVDNRIIIEKESKEYIVTKDKSGHKAFIKLVEKSIEETDSIQE